MPIYSIGIVHKPLLGWTKVSRYGCPHRFERRKSPEEPAQNGVGVERAPERNREFLSCLGPRIGRLCALSQPFEGCYDWVAAQCAEGALEGCIGRGVEPAAPFRLTLGGSTCAIRFGGFYDGVLDYRVRPQMDR